MTSTATTIATITAGGFAQRMAPLIPRGWANDGAKQPGGNLYNLLDAMGTQLSFAISGIQYALGSTRIQTAVGIELDLASEDFLGNALPRPLGMSDSDFRALILKTLLPKTTTRQAMSNAILALTGVVPRIIEPWQPGDTGALDTKVSYLDIDQRDSPLRLSSEDRYQAFIITPPPAFTGLGTSPLYTLDDTGFLDANLFDVQLRATNISQLYSVINNVRPFGTIVWVQLVPSQNISLMLLEGGSGSFELEGLGGSIELEGSSGSL